MVKVLIIQKILVFTFAVLCMANVDKSRAADNSPAGIEDFNRKQLVSIKNLSLKVNVTNTPADKFSIAPDSKNFGDRFVFSYSRMGDFYRFDVSSIEEGRSVLQQSQAFDGERYQCLLPEDGGLLIVGTKPVATASFPLFYNILVLPFVFLGTDGTLPTEVMPGLDLNAIQQPQAWSSFLSSAKTEGRVAWGGEEFLMLKYPVKVAGDGKTLKPVNVTYEIYFSTKLPNYPVLIQKRDAQDKLWAEYYVEKIAMLGSVLYPEKSLTIFYKEGQVPDFRLLYEVEMVKINSENFDETEFMIDVGMSRRIHDVDANKFIKIPK